MRIGCAALGAAAYIAVLIASRLTLAGYEICSAAVLGALAGYFFGWLLEVGHRSMRGH